MHAAVKNENFEIIQLLLNNANIDANIKDEIHIKWFCIMFQVDFSWFLVSYFCEKGQLIVQKMNRSKNCSNRKIYLQSFMIKCVEFSHVLQKNKKKHIRLFANSFVYKIFILITYLFFSPLVLIIFNFCFIENTISNI